MVAAVKNPNVTPAFSRRRALGLLSLATAAAGLGRAPRAGAANGPSAPSPAATPGRNPGWYRFTVGNLRLTVLNDGHYAFQPVQPFWAPEGSPEEVKATLERNFLPSDRLKVSFNALLVDNGKEVLLCDSGCGKLLAPTTGRLRASLAEAGYAPDDVTAVFLSHAHVDHFGGLLAAEGTPVFANAKHLVSQPELEFWMGPHPDLSKANLDDATRASFVTSAQRMFSTLGKRFEPIPEGASLIDGVTTVAAPGHTPGHRMVQVGSGPDRLLHTVDLAHNQALMFEHPDWTMAADTDPGLARETRLAVLNAAATERTRLLGYHLPFPALGHVRKREEGFEWVPEPWGEGV